MAVWTSVTTFSGKRLMCSGRGGGVQCGAGQGTARRRLGEPCEATPVVFVPGLVFCHRDDLESYLRLDLAGGHLGEEAPAAREGIRGRAQEVRAG